MKYNFEIIHDKEKYPDCTSFSCEETARLIFDVSSRTMRNWRQEKLFPEPEKIAGGKGYYLGGIRAFLTAQANESVKRIYDTKNATRVSRSRFLRDL